MTYCITMHRDVKERWDESGTKSLQITHRWYKNNIINLTELLDKGKFGKYYPHVLLSKHLLSWRPRYGFKEAFKSQRLCLKDRIRQPHDTCIHKLHETHLFLALINYSKKCLICLRSLLLNIFVRSCSVIFRGTAEVKASHVEVSSPHIGRLSFKSFIVKTSVSWMSIFRTEAHMQVIFYGLSIISYAFEVQYMCARTHMQTHTSTHTWVVNQRGYTFK